MNYESETVIRDTTDYFYFLSFDFYLRPLKQNDCFATVIELYTQWPPLCMGLNIWISVEILWPGKKAS